MKWTILGSGGCMVIPKPLCRCRICREAREKGIPYARTGPAVFLHDINMLIDTPTEIISQLNRAPVKRIDYLTFSHLDPDHIEGFRMVEQLTLDFRTWRAYPEKQICLLLPEQLSEPFRKVRSQYGSILDFYRESGFIRLELFRNTIQIGEVGITAVPVDRGSQISFVYVFEKARRRVVYAPCDIKPFPKHREEVQNADLLMIQPGIFEEGLKHGFRYPADHISRTTLYTFEQTLELASQLNARKTVFIHLEEYWNRSYDDYRALEAKYPGVRFAYDGMQLRV
ncbi:MBL fold metallo-hydrolase [Chloroflexota bacterium]